MYWGRKKKLILLMSLLLMFSFSTAFLWAAGGNVAAKHSSFGKWFSNFVHSSFTTHGKWFKKERTNLFLAFIIMWAVITYYISSARRGKELFIRKIAGLAAIDDAVGRATEMGRPILYVSGIMDMDDIQTLAGISILGHVSQKAAEYETPLIVPCSRAMVMSTSQEVVKEAYLRAGRPDAYDPRSVRYLTDDQFGFAAGVDGILTREKPAAAFYLGTFYAESLILAETGNHIGAIQIAGTAMPSQLPFFITACDYTLIGEELFAASAYISREPQMLGGLKGQDVLKIVAFFIMLLGSLAATFLSITNKSSVSTVSFSSYPLEVYNGENYSFSVNVQPQVVKKDAFPLSLEFSIPHPYSGVVVIQDDRGNLLNPQVKEKENLYTVKMRNMRGEIKAAFTIKVLKTKKEELTNPKDIKIPFVVKDKNGKAVGKNILLFKYNGGSDVLYSFFKSFIDAFEVE
jgi:hypothetical protein